MKLLKNKIYKAFSASRGSALLMVGFTMTSVLLMLSFVLDFGSAYIQTSKLQNACDAAALAAAAGLPAEKLDYLKTQAVMNTAYDYLVKNGFPSENAEVVLTYDVSGEYTGVRVKSKNNINLYISRIIGIDKLSVERQSAARIAPARSVRGAAPLSIEKSYLENAILTNQTKHLLLKVGSQGGVNGSFGVIDFNGSNSGGSNDYEEWLTYGYFGLLKSGNELIPVETGNMSGATLKAFQIRNASCTHFLSLGGCTIYHYVPTCKRITIIPVITYTDKHTVTIDGFAAFILESVGGTGNESYIIGSFVETVASGTTETDPFTGINDYGVYVKYLTE